MAHVFLVSFPKYRLLNLNFMNVLPRNSYFATDLDGCRSYNIGPSVREVPL